MHWPPVSGVRRFNICPFHHRIPPSWLLMDRPNWHTIFGRLGNAWRLETPALCYDSTTNSNQSHLRWGCAPWTNERMYQQDVTPPSLGTTGPFMLCSCSSPALPSLIRYFWASLLTSGPLDRLYPSLWHGNA